MIRNQDKSSSVIQVFSSHFFTTLRKEGTDAVESWTSRRNIDIFKKRLLFIPINKSLHWSLCVVVNPVKVFLGDKIVGDKSSWNDFESTAMSSSTPGCILFFDSLKAHRKNEVAKHIRNWLNAEWKRLKMPVSSFDPPFSRDTFPLVSPLGKSTRSINCKV
jgi:Ulp1 family protease